MTQLPLYYGPHCANCHPSRWAENLRILESCTDDWIAKVLATPSWPMDLSGCTPEEAAREEWHHFFRREQFLEVQRRRAAGAKRKESVTLPRSVRVPCVDGCGRAVHPKPDGDSVCRQCANKRHFAERRQAA